MACFDVVRNQGLYRNPRGSDAVIYCADYEALAAADSSEVDIEGRRNYLTGAEERYSFFVRQVAVWLM